MEIILIIISAILINAAFFAIGRRSMRNDYNRAFRAIEHNGYRLRNLLDFRNMYVRLTTEIDCYKKELKEAREEMKKLKDHERN